MGIDTDVDYSGNKAMKAIFVFKEIEGQLKFIFKMNFVILRER